MSKLDTARYILFSTHGLLGGEFRGVSEPSLALTLPGNPPNRDGFLTMNEVIGLDINAEMVILSACNTYGQSDNAVSGEGFAGLTRSFMYAGAKSILVTHWNVESQASRELINNLFELKKQMKSVKALRSAKFDMKNSIRINNDLKTSLPHPFFWAPFVLVG